MTSFAWGNKSSQLKITGDALPSELVDLAETVYKKARAFARARGFVFKPVKIKRLGGVLLPFPLSLLALDGQPG